MNRLKNTFIIAALAALTLFSSCGDDDFPDTTIITPATYEFERNGQTSVAFSGQAQRIQMGVELINAMKDFDNATAASLLEMYRNADPSGGDVSPFANADLNSSTKSIKSKVAASRDFFSTNTAEASVIKADFEGWINEQVTDVFPNQNTLASAGVAGQLADGSSTRYVNAKGLELNQAVNKGLIGGLMLDQVANNYLSTSILDEASNVDENNNDVVADGKNYTIMEHKWDEAYGYVYAAAANTANPNSSLADRDDFIGKYIMRVESDTDFTGIANEIFAAFSLGRAAIVAKDYTIRDAQAALIKTRLSEVVAIRAVYYLQQAKFILEQANPEYGGAFHDLSEGFGFVYSLRFTRRFENNQSYFSKEEVDGLLNDLYGATNGFWEVTPTTLDAVSTAIAAKFNFTVAQAGSTN